MSALSFLYLSEGASTIVLASSKGNSITGKLESEVAEQNQVKATVIRLGARTLLRASQLNSMELSKILQSR